VSRLSKKRGGLIALASVLAAAIVIFGVLLQSRFNSAQATRPLAIPARDLAQLRDANSQDSDHSANQEAPLDAIQAQLYQERAYPNDVIAPDALVNGLKQYELVSSSNSGHPWQFAGPTYAPGAVYHDPYTGATLSASGRLTAIKAVPSSCHTGGCDVIYAGTADGGVWKTTDGGQTWSSVFEDIQSQAIGAIAIDPVNSSIVYVGTGEPNRSGDSHRGGGIFVTTDGGGHWSAALGFNQFVNRAVAGIVIDPRGAGNPSTTSLYVVDASAASGESVTGGTNNVPFTPDRGFYYSTNGGQNWTHSNPTSISTPCVYSSTFGFSNMPATYLLMDPNNPNVLYAGFTSCALYRSTDDGLTWTQLAGGLPGPQPAANADNFHIAISKASPTTTAGGVTVSSTIYVAYATPSSAGQIFKSTDGGASFTHMAAPNYCSGQCFYDMPIMADPTNNDTVYVGGVETYDGYAFNGYQGCSAGLANTPPSPYPNVPDPIFGTCATSLMKTTDGGANWYDISESDRAGGALRTGTGVLHPDAHAIFVNPADPNTVYQGSDGGIFKTQNATSLDPNWVSLNKGLATLQVQGMAVGPTGQIFFGTQDNGTFWLPAGSMTTRHINNGDGGLPIADPVNPDIAYTAFTRGTLYRDDDVMCLHCNALNLLYQDYGGFTTGYTQIADWTDTAQFYAPHEVAPSNANVIFEGTNRIIRSLDKGGFDGNGDQNANNDSTDSTGGAGTNMAGNWAPLSNTSSFGGGNIAQIAVSPTDPNVIAVATTFGRIYYTTNALSDVTVTGNCDARTTPGLTMQCTYQSGINWVRIDNVGVTTPNRYPSSLTFEPGSTTKLYATFSGFYLTSDPAAVQGHVFVTDISGGTTASWQNINGSSPVHTLPNLPANSLVANPKHPNHLYLAADTGTFFSPNGGGQWLRIDHELPATPVYQLLYDTSTNTLLAATHGRGIWRRDAP